MEMAIYAIESHHPSEELDALIHAVVDEELVGMIIVPPTGAWLYHPYDGAADVIAPSPHDRGPWSAFSKPGPCRTRASCSAETRISNMRCGTTAWNLKRRRTG
jgi:hypothetical protein